MEKNKKDRIIGILEQTKLFPFFKNRVCQHLKVFWLPWFFLAILAVACAFGYETRIIIMSISMGLFVIALVFRPLNIIHGLIGARGDVKMFFLMFCLINFLFSGIYYYGFFQFAGITFDVSQPHVEFFSFEEQDRSVKAMVIEEENPTVVKNNRMEQLDFHGVRIKDSGDNEKKVATKKTKYEYLPRPQSESAHFYHRIDYIWVLQNTFLTSLMQEPTEFYSFTCTYNGNHDYNDRNAVMARGFHWFLVFHILVSWIFLGVFISLIYQKFRNM